MPLLIERFRVTSAGNVVFDERFAEGVNVIDGENSSGKSTLFKLIYFGLGGALTAKQWTKAALKCDRVYVQAKIGPAILTLSRKVAETGLPPFLIFDGDLDAALSSPIEEWQELSYSRSSDRQSFSQLMFLALGMPDAFSQGGDFITFNQFLRAHYADQDSANSSLLRFEGQFDKAATREAIGNFILGGTDQNLAELERKLLLSQSKYSESLSSVAAGNILLGGDYNELSSSGLDAAEDRISTETLQLEKEISKRSMEMLRPIIATDISQDRIAGIAARLAEAKGDLADRIASRSELDLEARDSALFISTLQQRVEYLTQTLNVADGLGDVQLDSCPACGTLVEPGDSHEHCYLCKSDAVREKPTARYFSMLNATHAQIEQSTRIQKSRLDHMARLIAEIANATNEIEQLARELETEKITVSTEGQAELSALQNRLGYLRGELERVRRDKRVVERLDVLRKDRDRWAGEIAATREEIDSIRNGVTLRLGGALSAVSRETGEFLAADLSRQAEFHDDPHVDIDFRGNSFAINGQTAISASSVSYLRNSIFLGLMFAANRIGTMRHLQFLMLENLEDKGMEPERYYRLHATIVSRAKTLTRPYQIIIGTADLSASVRNDVYIVGRRYSHNAKTLNMIVVDDEVESPGLDS